jgi:hypothetical protein
MAEQTRCDIYLSRNDTLSLIASFLGSLFMSEDHAQQRKHVHPVMLNAALEIAIVKIQAKLECGKCAAILYMLTEGAKALGVISKEDHDLLARRYSRKLVDVIARKEDSHVPVLTIEKQREQQMLAQKDKQFKGMLEQWDLHKDLKWRSKAFAEAAKFETQLESARAILQRRPRSRRDRYISQEETRTGLVGDKQTAHV